VDSDTACSLLGLKAEARGADVEKAFAAKKALVEQRLAIAPTPALREKYRAALEELVGARNMLVAEPVSPAPHLSKTQMVDLPGAQPLLTRHGAGGGGDAATPNLIQPGQVIANRYEVHERIGMGGMGAVYRAFDRNRQEEIAIKVLLPHLLRNATARERFLAEAKISITLTHPNIVNVFDVQRDGDNDFLTMELLQGQTLRAVMQSRKAARQHFVVNEAVAIAEAIGGALEYAHKRTVHRDLKPENVWVCEDAGQSRQYKLMDFGIARVFSNSHMTQTATAMGSAYYMAPEQLHGAKDVDGRADQYALAVLMYELLSGEVPAGRIKPLRELDSEVPRSFSAAVEKALSARPSERYPTMAAFVTALRAPLGALPRARWIAVVAGALVLLATLVVLGPRLSDLLPDREQNNQWRTHAIEAQGVTESLLKRVESSEQDIDASLRDAKAQVDRIEGNVRMARSDAELEALRQQLSNAKYQYDLWDEVQTLTGRAVFRTEAIAEIRGQVNVGVAALRDNQLHKAADELTTAQKAAEALAALTTTIRETISAKIRAESALADLTAICTQEKEPITADTDKTVIEHGDASLAAGNYAAAGNSFNQAAADLGKTLNQVLEKLAANYTSLATRATAAEDYDNADVALRRAKALLALKRS
jgi:serine/threonine protein kinase